MRDMIERLRSFKENVSNDMIDMMETPEVCIEAAKALEQKDAEIEHLKALLREAAETAEYAAHQLEKARIWSGMDWHYNPLHPLHYRSASERLRDMIPRIRAALGEDNEPVQKEPAGK